MLKLDIVKSVHKEFVDNLHSRYGLISHPGYSGINLCPILNLGAFSWNPSPTIYIQAKNLDDEIDGANSLEEIIDTTCHETGHFLHSSINITVREKSREKKLSIKNRFLGEVIADFGSFIFISERYGYERVEKYLANMGSHSANVAYDVFRADPNVLSKITNQEIRKASFLMKPYLQRELYPENLKKFFRIF